MMRTSNFFALASLALLASLSGCRSSKIATEGGSTTLSTSKKAVISGIEQKAAEPIPFATYYAKNASTHIEMGTQSFSLKSNLFMDLGKETVIAARVPFPPLVVGNVKITEGKVAVKSGLLSVNQSINLPAGVAQMLQSAVLGLVPDVYTLFGEADFKNYDISITPDDCYRLTRKRGAITVEILLRGDYSLSKLSLHGPQEMVVDVLDWSDFQGNKLPSHFSLSLNMGGKSAQNITADVVIGKVQIDGSDRLSFE